MPFSSIYKVVDCVEKEARISLCKWAHLSKETNAKLLMQVLTKTRNATFQSLDQHNKETHILDSELRPRLHSTGATSVPGQKVLRFSLPFTPSLLLL